MRIGCSAADQPCTDEQADELLASPQGQLIAHNAAATPRSVRRRWSGSTSTASPQLVDADELIVAHQTATVQERLRSVELTAEAMGLPA